MDLVFPGPAHHIGRRPFVPQFIGHIVHIWRNVVEEMLVSFTQMIQAFTWYACFGSTVFRAPTPAKGFILAFAAFCRQHSLLFQAEVDLFL